MADPGTRFLGRGKPGRREQPAHESLSSRVTLAEVPLTGLPSFSSHGRIPSRRIATMTTIQLTLPDDLAKKATEAGLLSAEAVQEMLREKLLRRAGESLREIRSRMPSEELTPEIEQEVVEAVQAYRAERRARRVG